MELGLGLDESTAVLGIVEVAGVLISGCKKIAEDLLGLDELAEVLCGLGDLEIELGILVVGLERAAVGTFGLNLVVLGTTSAERGSGRSGECDKKRKQNGDGKLHHDADS